MQPVPASLSLTDTAFFFDFDGTLVDLAPTPDGIHVPDSLPAMLGELRALARGAVAIVSGRGIDSIDSFLGLADLPVAGLHGAERRDANGDTMRVGFNDERLLRIERELAAVVERNPGTLLEIKGAAVALHFRNAPEREGVAREAAERLVAEYPDAYVLQPGKMVFEIKPKGVDKGRAITAFLGEPPFAGRRPVFAGDDLTDETGFAVVDAAGGLSIKIGAGDTSAKTRLDSVEAMRARIAQWIAAGRAQA
ncbi:trehalose-phosphatase [Burkholderia gladioli]|uniref:trehalose-phosphatase n=1 Tax=Burkholderia gladioli TaxID=28095 RepID=UPI001C23302F|nr:trehalose-phosphatase [Burkholderia gladioli]MBU9213544.1 trehalose-phosphatase [Burkholderia gladioli]MDN7727491.1 trehalose-phosphatase [Burkholderia gladioli]